MDANGISSLPLRVKLWVAGLASQLHKFGSSPHQSTQQYSHIKKLFSLLRFRMQRSLFKPCCQCTYETQILHDRDYLRNR
mmetsp:Transcript_90271/g.264075  ORF Transcript_90271/g.264075 Transcript_90271/m.264075 type:complete len:80 (+) Transcript_90271:1641-1880(+)